MCAISGKGGNIKSLIKKCVVTSRKFSRSRARKNKHESGGMVKRLGKEKKKNRSVE